MTRRDKAIEIGRKLKQFGLDFKQIGIIGCMILEYGKEAQQELVNEINEAISKCENDNEELSAIARIINRKV